MATVLECKPHANADKLLVLQIDLGTEKRQIPGLRQHVADPQSLVGKQIVVVANLAPRQMRRNQSGDVIGCHGRGERKRHCCRTVSAGRRRIQGKLGPV